MPRLGRPPKNPELAKRFVKNLKRHAEAKSLTQQAIAVALGETPARVSNWFRGVSMPPEALLLQLIAVLGVSREQMFE